jgi:putative ABC transport system permease protein
MSWLKRLFSRRRMYDELSAEIREHLEEKIEELVAKGMPRKEAETVARREFGNVTLMEERGREVWQWPRLESFVMDVRYGLRMLRKSPGFTAVAVLTLALGIGASTAVFSLVDAVLLKPLPFPHAEEIASPWKLIPSDLNLGFDRGQWGRVDFQFVSQQSKTFEDLGAFLSDSFDLTGSGDPVRLDGLRASAGFFPSLGVSPALGRTFTHQEDDVGREREVILSDALWRGRFGADPNILGRTLELNATPYMVIGVMPRGFAFPRANEMPPNFTFAPGIQLWVPLALNRGPFIPAEPQELAVIGRLKEGTTIAQAQAEMNILGKRFADQYHLKSRFFHYEVTSLARQISGDARRPLLLILGAVSVVLLIACSNVASLLLTRSLGRKRELTVRAALGARNGRLIRQLLTESVVLAGAGGFAGVILGQCGVYLAKAFGPSSIPRLSEASLDMRVLTFALGTTLFTGILFGLAPAISVTCENLVEPLKSGGQRSGSSPTGQRTRNSLLVSQIALALILVIAAGLLTRTFYQLLAVDPGFHPAHALTFDLSLPALKYPDQPHIVSFYNEALRRLQGLPGIQAAGLTEIVPMGGATENTSLRIPDRLQTSALDVPNANYTMVSPGYFSAVGTLILRGRSFLESDDAGSTPVTIISDAMAKKYWPEQDPLGKQVGPKSPIYPVATIVGIAADVKHLSLREAPPPEMYVPYTQKVWPSLLTMSIVLRTTQDPASIATSAREAIHSIDPDLPIANVRTLDNIVDDSMTVPRFAVLFLGAFGGLALILATVGMYGVISYSVAQRTQEIGIRMALGAQQRDVLKMVLRYGIRLAGIGLTIGLAAAFGVTRLMKSFLYGVQPADPLTFASVVILLMLVALAACYVPARRAMKVDPMVALRYE